MRITESFSAIVKSCYSGAFYREVARKWKGTGLRFLLLMCLVIVTPSAIRLHEVVHYFLDDTIAEQIPAFSVHKGVLNFGETPLPINIYDRAQPDKILLTIDALQTPPVRESSGYLVITPETIWIRDQQQNFQRISVKTLLAEMGIRSEKPIEVSRELILKMFGEIRKDVPLLIASYLLVTALLLWLLFAFRALVMSGFGIFFCSLLKIQMSFSTLYRLSTVTLTPLLLLEGISMAVFEDIFVYKKLIYFLLHSALLYHALDNLRKKAR